MRELQGRTLGIGGVMKCGVCQQHYGELMIPHAEVCEDDRKAPAQRYSPEKTINDIKREREENA
jgi:hypothetical protein